MPAIAWYCHSPASCLDRFALAAKLNQQRTESLGVLFAEYAQRCDQVYVYHMDSRGFDLIGKANERGRETWFRVRLDFPEPKLTAAACEEAIENAIDNALYAQQTPNQ